MRLLRSISIAGLTLFLFQLLALPVSSKAAPVVVQPGKIRPYAGIGILLLAPLQESAADSPGSPVLYEEPSVFRIGTLDATKAPPYEWIFGSGDYATRLIVTSRKGGWLRVVYDEAGREAWLKPPPQGQVPDMEQFPEGAVCQLAGRTAEEILSGSTAARVCALRNPCRQKAF
jgi:hypothetical protein